MLFSLTFDFQIISIYYFTLKKGNGNYTYRFDPASLPGVPLIDHGSGFVLVRDVHRLGVALLLGRFRHRTTASQLKRTGCTHTVHVVLVVIVVCTEGILLHLCVVQSRRKLMSIGGIDGGGKEMSSFFKSTVLW